MTLHVTLRDVEERDLLTFHDQQRDPEAMRMAAFPSRDRGAFMAHWATILGEETIVVQTILLDTKIAGHIISWEQSGARKVGYWLGREFWGRGIASAALSQFLARITMRPLIAHVAKHNLASLRVLQKSGFEISREDTVLAPTGEPIEEFTLTLGA